MRNVVKVLFLYCLCLGYFPTQMTTCHRCFKMMLLQCFRISATWLLLTVWLPIPCFTYLHRSNVITNDKDRFEDIIRRQRRDDDDPTLTRSEWLDLLTVVTDNPTDDDTTDNISEESQRKNSSFIDISRLTHDSSHCLNGGIGFLGSFCVCPADFYGQYCEIRIKKDCELIDHGAYIYIDCSLCFCNDGDMECVKHPLPDCEEKERERLRMLNGQAPLSPQLSLLLCTLLIAIVGISYSSETMLERYMYR